MAIAVREVAADGAAKFIAGGTNLIDLMKANVELPSRLIDIARLAPREVQDGPRGYVVFNHKEDGRVREVIAP